MKNIKIHYNENGNLISIKPLEDIYADRQYLISVIDNLFKRTKGCLYIEASRPNFEVNHIIEKLKTILKHNDSFESNDFRLSFQCNEITNELFYILAKIWFAYEHGSISFFPIEKINFEINQLAWYDITTYTDSIVMFKGVEEDVIWIGKSDKYEFNLENLYKY